MTEGHGCPNLLLIVSDAEIIIKIKIKTIVKIQ